MYFHRKPVTQLNSEIAMRETSRELKMIRQLTDGYSMRTLKNKLLTHEN
jgi:hypothetical protein